MSSSRVSTQLLAKHLKQPINEIVGRHVKRDDAIRLINAVFEGIAHELQHARRVTVRGFGSFNIVARKGYVRKASGSGFLKGHNRVRDRVVVKFYPSSKLDADLQRTLREILFGNKEG